MTQAFQHRHLLTTDDYLLMGSIIGNPLRYPDLVIAPDGQPYLYRWHVARGEKASVYFHIQVSSDPERPLHDHPWDNMSVILSGGYDELWDDRPWDGDHGDPPSPPYVTRRLRAGMTCFRKAEEAHRLLLPECFSYTMTLFSCGPKVREWGFWYPDGWRPYTEVTQTADGKSVHIKREVVNG